MEAHRLTVLKGGESIHVYIFGEGSIEHCFCPQCGIRTFGRSTEKSPMHPFAAINVATLDVAPEDFMKFSVTYLDGKHDQQVAPDITGYL